MENKRLNSFLSTLASVILALAIWALILAISNKNPQPFDITKNSRFTLAAQSKQAVQNLAVPVKLYAFVTDKEKAKTEELLKRYLKVDDKKFTFEVVDPRKHPSLAKKFNIRMTGEGVIEVQGKDGGNGRVERLTQVAEEEVTTALLKLQRSQSFKVYFIGGHGERTLAQSDGRGLGQLKGDLAKEGFVLADLNLAASPKIPEDASLLVCAGPTKPLLPGEQKLLQDYLAGYGRLMMLFEPETPANYSELVKPYGVEVPEQVVLDQASQMLGAEPTFAVGISFDPAHPITKDYAMQTIFDMARPVNPLTPPPAGVVLTKLVSTSQQPVTALLVPLKDILGQTRLRLDPSKLKPSVVCLAVAATKKAEEPKASPSPSPSPAAEKPKTVKEMRLLTLGDADIMSDGQTLRMYQINRDFVLNSLNWLASNETQISIRPQDPLSTPLTLKGKDEWTLAGLFILVLPASLVGLGLFNVMRRQ